MALILPIATTGALTHISSIFSSLMLRGFHVGGLFFKRCAPRKPKIVSFKEPYVQSIIIGASKAVISKYISISVGGIATIFTSLWVCEALIDHEKRLLDS